MSLLFSTPVWTAFIHFQLNSAVWLVPPTDDHPNRVLLRDLNRHVMAPEYHPEVDRAGRHVLNFTIESGKPSPKTTLLSSPSGRVCVRERRLSLGYDD